MDKSQLLKHSRTWDRTGVAIATLCLIHCLAFPILIMLVPATQTLFNSPILEGTILGMGIVVGSISFWTSYRRHKKIYPMVLGVLGIILLLSHLVVFRTDPVIHSMNHETTDWNSLWSHLTIEPLMVLGGALLIIGHLWNIRACHCFCDTACDHDHHH